MAPNSLFIPELFNSLYKFNVNSDKLNYYDYTSSYFDFFWDNEDYLEEYTGGGALIKPPLNLSIM